MIIGEWLEAALAIGVSNLRKTCPMTLTLQKSIIEEQFEKLGIQKDIRAERLTIEQFDAICDIIFKIKSK